MMNDLRRDNAPFSNRVWARIDDAARGVLKTMLAARRLVDFDGPKGWDHSAVDLGRANVLGKSPEEGVRARIRTVRPLIEIERRSDSIAGKSKPWSGAPRMRTSGPSRKRLDISRAPRTAPCFTVTLRLASWESSRPPLALV